MKLKSSIDFTEIFCDVDDFYQSFEKHCSSEHQLAAQVLQLPPEKKCSSCLSLSELITIVIAFHGSRSRNFKDFYTLQALPNWKKAFPNLVSCS